MRAIGVYVFAGGFSLGVRHFFDIIAHCEDPKPYGEEVIEANREEYWGDMPVIPWPKWDQTPGPVDFIYANPPCAPFSNNNINSYIEGSWKSDPRIKCWQNVVDFAKKKKAFVVAMETVPQAYTKAPELVKATLESLQEEYPYVYLIFHNIALMGSIQNRNRLFIVGSKGPLPLSQHEFTFPIQTVSCRFEMMEALNIAPGWSLPVANKYLPIVKATLPGESMRDAFNRLIPEEKRVKNSQGNVIGRPSFNIKRLDPNDRVNTLCGFAHIHPVLNRYVSVKEYQILADYPPSYNIPGKCEGYGYISRAVSPEAGEWIARLASMCIEKWRNKVGFTTRKLIIFDGISRGDKPIWFIHDMSKDFPKIKLSRRY